MENLTEHTLSSELIFDGKVVHLYFDRITLPDGKEATREYIKHIGAVCVVPLTDEGEVVCVRQYRYPLGRTVLEIPAGKLDYKGEDTLEAAVRELREETGAICRSIEFIGKLHPSPAILDECISMYLARGLDWGETDPDDDEFIQVEKVPLDTLCGMICRGEITDAKTQAAVLKTKYIIENGGGSNEA